MAETLSMISIISFAGAAVCLVMAIIFFVYFKIPSVIGDLSGRTARKSIEQMRVMNEKSGKKVYKPDKVNLERGKLTATMHGAGKVSDRPETGVLDENAVGIIQIDETMILHDRDETGILEEENETTQLDGKRETVPESSGGIRIELLEEVMLVHTDEVIP